MKKLSPKDVDAKLIAYLYDRVHINQGKKQYYGTQLNYNNVPFEIEDSEHVNERRLAIGLESLEEYIKKNVLRHFSC